MFARLGVPFTLLKLDAAILAPMVAGDFMALQTGINSTIGRGVGGPAFASMLSTMMSLGLLLLLYIHEYVQEPSDFGCVAREAEWWAYCGGFWCSVTICRLLIYLDDRELPCI
ncbi:hypothetical protein BC830DRAFT_1171935 [Chytriomyces sp. MP71]|nr:hypothetical protein BC830DRAFT_1171935 [Chytriomyces sp. MP71]